MPNIRDAKSMAKVLEVSLSSRNISLSHGECLDIVARQFGLKDWNVLSAKAKRQEAVALRRAVELKGWFFLSQFPSDYDHGIDENAGPQGQRSALIRLDTKAASRHYPNTAQAHGGYLQAVSAVPFRGGKVEIQANLRCEGVTHGATIWARADTMPGHTLTFDNLKEASEGWLFGDAPWSRRRIVIDVPPEAITLNFGFFLKGLGSLWAANFSVEKAPDTAALTARPIEPQRRQANWMPIENLDFAKVIRPTGDGRFTDAS
jgi:hypothetical protein